LPMASIVFREIGFIFLTFFKYLLLEPGRRETQKLAVKNRVNYVYWLVGSSLTIISNWI